MDIILGIDPGLQKTGWGIIKSSPSMLSFVSCGIIKTDSSLSIPARMKTLHDELSNIIKLYQPNNCAIEETFVNKNPLSSLKLGHARGALVLTTQLAGLNLGEYPATVVKKSVVGMGHASKDQVMTMIKFLLPTSQVKYEDAADALAVAICHAAYINSPLAKEKILG